MDPRGQDDRRIAYDEDLATRITDLIGPDPELTAGFVATTNAAAAVMPGRAMPGWLRVSPEDLASDGDIPGGRTSASSARSLPPKQSANRKPKK